MPIEGHYEQGRRMQAQVPCLYTVMVRATSKWPCGQGEMALGQGFGQIVRDQIHIRMLVKLLHLCYNNNQLHGP